MSCLLVVCTLFACVYGYDLQAILEGPGYGFYPSNDADLAIRTSGSNYVIDQTDLIDFYTGEKAIQCKKFIEDKTWFTETNQSLLNVVVNALIKLKELDDKLIDDIDKCGIDRICYVLTKTLGIHEVDKLRDQAQEKMWKIKKTALKKIKSFLNDCVA